MPIILASPLAARMSATCNSTDFCEVAIRLRLDFQLKEEATQIRISAKFKSASRPDAPPVIRKPSRIYQLCRRAYEM